MNYNGIVQPFKVINLCQHIPNLSLLLCINIMKNKTL